MGMYRTRIVPSFFNFFNPPCKREIPSHAGIYDAMLFLLQFTCALFTRYCSQVSGIVVFVVFFVTTLHDITYQRNTFFITLATFSLLHVEYTHTHTVFPFVVRLHLDHSFSSVFFCARCILPAHIFSTYFVYIYCAYIYVLNSKDFHNFCRLSIYFS